MQTYFSKKRNDEGNINGHDVETLIKIGISLAVSVIPEGLVAVTTVTMALSVQRMASRNVVVRKMPAVETIGSLTVICSDKVKILFLFFFYVPPKWVLLILVDWYFDRRKNENGRNLDCF